MADELSGEERIKVPAKEVCTVSAVALPADFGACLHDCMRGPPCDNGRLRAGSQIATDFILHAPYGELREVVSDVQVLCGGESVLADALPVTFPACAPGGAVSVGHEAPVVFAHLLTALHDPSAP
jgi:hypothetical protein